MDRQPNEISLMWSTRLLTVIHFHMHPQPQLDAFFLNAPHETT